MKFEPADGARITYFHVLWLTLAAVGAATAWWWSRPLGVWWCAAITIGAFIVAVPLGGLLVMFLVTSIVIPRLTRGSAWSFEVNAYMLSMLGREWADAGKPRPDPDALP